MANETNNCAQVSRFLIGEQKAIRDIGLVRDKDGKVTLAVTVWIPTGSRPAYRAIVATTELDEAARLGILAALDWKGTNDTDGKESSAGKGGATVGVDSRHPGNGGTGGTPAKGGKVQ